MIFAPKTQEEAMHIAKTSWLHEITPHIKSIDDFFNEPAYSRIRLDFKKIVCSKKFAKFNFKHIVYPNYIYNKTKIIGVLEFLTQSITTADIQRFNYPTSYDNKRFIILYQPNRFIRCSVVETIPFIDANDPPPIFTDYCWLFE